MSKVRFAKLHVAYFDVGCGNLGDTLGDPNKHRDMEIEKGDDGLYVRFKGVKFFVPSSNVVGCTFAPEEKVSPAVKPHLG